MNNGGVLIAPTGGQEATITQSFFDEYAEDHLFNLLRCKHTLADLVHDYGKQFLDAYFTPDQIINRIRSSYTTISDADMDELRNFFALCTTDAAAKKTFYKELDTFLFQKNKSSFDTYTGGIEYTTSELDTLFETMLGNMNSTGSLYWYLDSQSGNIIKKYEDYRIRRSPGSEKNNFCVDAASIADPGSGIDPTKISSLNVLETGIPVILPKEISALGKTLTLTANSATDVNALWDGSAEISIRSNERTTSIENVCRIISGITEDNTEQRLDWLFLKTSGDRAQAYSCNTIYNPIRPIFKTLDILASIDAMLYKKCPVLLSGPNSIKLYQFGEQPEQTLTDDEAAILLQIYGPVDTDGRISEENQLKINTLFDNTIAIIENYFNETLLEAITSNNVLLFSKGSGPIQQGPNHAITGFLYTLIDTIEKIHCFQTILGKNNEDNRALFYDIKPLPGSLPVKYSVKYKPLLGGENTFNYFRTDLFYNKSTVMYNNIATIISSLVSNSENSNMSFMHVKDTLFQEISNNINRFTTSGVCPVNLISLFITVLMLAVTTPVRPESTTFSRSGRTTLINRAIDQRNAWIKTIMNHVMLQRQFGLMFTELLIMKVTKDGMSYIHRDGAFFDSVHGGMITPDSLSISDYTITEIDFNPTINYSALTTYIPLLKKIISWSFDTPLPTGFIDIPAVHIKDINIFRIGEIPREAVTTPVSVRTPIPSFIQKKIYTVKNISNKRAKISPKKILSIKNALEIALSTIANTNPRAYRIGSTNIKNLQQEYISRGITKPIFKKFFDKFKPVQKGGDYGFDILDYPYTESDCYEEEVNIGDTLKENMIIEDDKQEDTIEYDDMGGISPSYGSIIETLTSIQSYTDTGFMGVDILRLSQLIADSILIGSILYNSQEPGDAINVLGEVTQFLTDINNLYIGNYKDISNKEAIEGELDIRTESSSASSSGSTKRSLSASTGTVDHHKYFRELFKRLLNGRFVSNIQIVSDNAGEGTTGDNDYYYGMKEIYNFIYSNEFITVPTKLLTKSGYSTPPYTKHRPTDGVYTGYPYASSMLLSAVKPDPIPYSPSESTNIASNTETPVRQQRRRINNSTFNQKLELALESTKTENDNGIGKRTDIISRGPSFATSQWDPTAATQEYEGGRRSRRRQRKRSTYKKKRASQKRRTYRRHN